MRTDGSARRRRPALTTVREGASLKRSLRQVHAATIAPTHHLANVGTGTARPTSATLKRFAPPSKKRK